MTWLITRRLSHFFISISLVVVVLIFIFHFFNSFVLWLQCFHSSVFVLSSEPPSYLPFVLSLPPLVLILSFLTVHCPSIFTPLSSITPLVSFLGGSIKLRDTWSNASCYCLPCVVPPSEPFLLSSDLYYPLSTLPLLSLVPPSTSFVSN